MNSTERQERLNAIADRKRKLITRPWFRALQVAFILASIFFEVLIGLFAFALQSLDTFIVGSAILCGIFYLIRAAAYYVFVGTLHTVEPQAEHLLETRLKP
jgi:hypothetical protein